MAVGPAGRLLDWSVILEIIRDSEIAMENDHTANIREVCHEVCSSLWSLWV